MLCVGKRQTFRRVVLWSPANEHKHLQLLITVLKDQGTASSVLVLTTIKQNKRVKLFNKSNSPYDPGQTSAEREERDGRRIRWRHEMATDDDAPKTNK